MAEREAVMKSPKSVPTTEASHQTWISKYALVDIILNTDYKKYDVDTITRAVNHIIDHLGSIF